MRVLVEQTAQVARGIVDRFARHVDEANRPRVHILMGGETPDPEEDEWFLHPERPAILIGTQDMLLSRVLNRGYASGRARWPVEFGLLNHDTLWVMDEVQLMDVGLATSAQLQAFREADRLEGKGFRPCHTWWMSATLQQDWLKSVDTESAHAEWVREPCRVEPAQRSGGLWEISKSLACETIEKDKHRDFASLILKEHAQLQDCEHGRITLVVCNTVERACQTFDALRSEGRNQDIELVHSRFRPAERAAWRERFLCREACRSGVDRIIVATQVVEAGVDISAGCLVTELAPWPGLVQRFGRCARYGGEGRVIVVDRGHDEKTSPPYDAAELASAWESLQAQTDVGIAALERYEESLTDEGRQRLYPYSPKHLLLRREFDELFDTTPDLTGADLDISRFIRSGDERDVQVFWLDIARDEKQPSNERRPRRDELCSVPFLKARDWLCGEETKARRKPKLRGGMRAWIWDWLDGEWVEANRAALLPGRVVCVAASCGGYRIERGFDPEYAEEVRVIAVASPSNDAHAVNDADDQQDSESLSAISEWKTIACHSREVAELATELAGQLGLPDELQRLLSIAGEWHDIGKSHPAFQGALRTQDDVIRPARHDLAKGPKSCWLKPSKREPCIYRPVDSGGDETGDKRPGFRHELASALALFAVLESFAPEHPGLLGSWGEAFALLGHSVPAAKMEMLPTPSIQRVLDCSADQFSLLAYLVASHHGKVRVALHASPKDQDYRDVDGRGLPIRGVRNNDSLPSISLNEDELLLPELPLTLEPASLGLSSRTGASWRERCYSLLAKHGPCGLAFLEAILRAADVRASRLNTADPTITETSR
jgi:CRISPR-associated endonuclease/helicase Cas3